MTGLASTAGLSVGMAVSGTNVAAGTVIAAIVSGTAVTLSAATTGAASSVTFTADIFKIALVKTSPTGTYGAATTNYSNLTGNSDEVSGTGYSAGGATLVNVSPTLTNPTTAASAGWTSPSWTSATISTTGAIIYNSTGRLGASSGITGRAVAVFDFGGTQSVTASTFTLTMPTQDGTSGIVRFQ
jgi:hypothetical protein